MCRYHFTTSAATHTTQQGGVPAVTFTYDLSPMQVTTNPNPHSNPTPNPNPNPTPNPNQVLRALRRRCRPGAGPTAWP